MQTDEFDGMASRLRLEDVKIVHQLQVLPTPWRALRFFTVPFGVGGFENGNMTPTG